MKHNMLVLALLTLTSTAALAKTTCYLELEGEPETRDTKVLTIGKDMNLRASYGDYVATAEVSGYKEGGILSLRAILHVSGVAPAARSRTSDGQMGLELESANLYCTTTK